ncbi:AraC-like DNA-binding protein [Kitasatospora viridis]|uniref:AraC-like DNA-binding protein n=2 Tax=Kitasatospora viridis TaxID=281105 RepID=A0A561T6J7_9ACTN|nr:AraC-like DNA-binding protein [Kitasatospora viridis]
MAGFRARSQELVDLGVVPYPAVTLVLDLGDGPLAVGDGTGRPQGGGLVLGLASSGVRGSGRGIECLQLRLSPVLAHAVLGGGAARAGGEVLPLEGLWGREAGRIEERLRAAGEWEERFALVAQALARRAAAGRAVDPEVAHAWHRLAASRGTARVERIAEEVGWSRKRLWSRFRDQLGLGPKRAAQLIRFDHAAHLLAAGRSAAGVAAQSGYADQSHLHREVLAFTGATPSAVAAAPWLAVDHVAWADPGYLSGR